MKKRGRRPSTPEVLLDHVKELQFRLLTCALILVAAGVVAYFYYQPIFSFLTSPLHQELYYTNPAGSFTFIMRICFVAGIAVTVPAIVYHLAMFLRPAFQKVFRLGNIIFTTVLSVVLAAAGAAFGYFFIIPGALKFFAGFNVKGLGALISADSYLNFVIGVLITFVLIFQLPLIMSLIDRIKPLGLKPLLAAEKWVILGGLLVALAVPFAFDITTCLLIAAPIIVLYNLSILLILVQHATAKRHLSKAERSSKRHHEFVEKLTDEKLSHYLPVPAQSAAASATHQPEPAMNRAATTQKPVARRTNQFDMKMVPKQKIHSPASLKTKSQAAATAPKTRDYPVRPLVTPSRPVSARITVPGRISDFRPTIN